MSIALDSGSGDYTAYHEEIDEDDVEFKVSGKLNEIDMLTPEEIAELPIEELLLKLLKSNMQVMANGRKIAIVISKLTDKQYDALVKRQSELMKDPSWMWFRGAMVISKIGAGFAGDKYKHFVEGAYAATEGGEGYTKSLNQADRAPVDAQVSSKMYAKQKEETELQNVNGKESEAKRKRDDMLDKLSQIIVGMLRN